MRVVLDLNPVLQNRHSGFYAVGAGMLQGFSQLEQKPEMVLFYSKRFKNDALELTKELGSWATPHETIIKKRWLEKMWQVSSFIKLESFVGEFDIFHSLHHMIPPSKNKPKILTVHDLRRYRLRHLYESSKLTAFESAVKKADHFITVSQATKDDLCEIFKVPETKIDVVHLAASTSFNPASEKEQTEIRANLSGILGTEPGRYLLAFSSPDQRKNISRIIEAFIASQAKIPGDIKLVIVGIPPKNDELFDNLVKNGLPERVILTGPLASISDIMKCAYGLVFTTLYEGFGVPIIEAFQCDVPVITSNISSMPEIADNAAITVDPTSTDEISAAITHLCTNNDKHRELIELGRQRRENFSWKKHAQEILKVYKKLS